MKEIVNGVSIIVPTYNHCKYIAQTLDGILMQKVNFPIEVYVGDDASTDQTADVMKKYELMHPGFFHMIYRKENLRKQPNKMSNGMDLLSRCNGKYLITIEGDDYWTDAYKLQKQYDFLESHPDYIAVAHNVEVVDEDSCPNGEVYPECKDNEYLISHFKNGILPGQTATLMYRNYFKCPNIDISILQKKLVPGDRLKAFVLVSYGRVGCIQETMSAYRHVTTNGSSYSATYKENRVNWCNYSKELMQYALQAKGIPKKNQLVAELLLFESAFYGWKKNEISYSVFKEYYMSIKHKGNTVFVFLLRYIKNFLKWHLREKPANNGNEIY